MPTMPIEVSNDLLAVLDQIASGVGATRAGVAREMLELGLALMHPGSHTHPVVGVPGAFQPLIVKK